MTARLCELYKVLVLLVVLVLAALGFFSIVYAAVLGYIGRPVPMWNVHIGIVSLVLCVLLQFVTRPGAWFDIWK